MDLRRMGHEIQRLRKAQNMTQEELAQKSGLSPKYISALENGRKSPKLETFLQVVNTLQCDANTLLVGDLEASVRQESESVSDKLLRLPLAKQKSLMRQFNVLIEDALANNIPE